MCRNLVKWGVLQKSLIKTVALSAGAIACEKRYCYCMVPIILTNSTDPTLQLIKPSSVR